MSGFSHDQAKIGDLGDRRVTPDWIFRLISERWGPFDLDVAAHAVSAKAHKWFGPGSQWAEDALADGLDWGEHGNRIWLQPPYSLLERFFAKAALSAVNGAYVVAFVFNRMDTAAFHDHASNAAEIVAIRGRVHCPPEPGTECGIDYAEGRRCAKLRNHDKEHGADNGSQTGHVLVVWRPGHRAEDGTKLTWWDAKAEQRRPETLPLFGGGR